MLRMVMLLRIGKCDEMYLKPKLILINVILSVRVYCKHDFFSQLCSLGSLQILRRQLWLFHVFLKICKMFCNCGFIRLSPGVNLPSPILHRAWCALLICRHEVSLQHGKFHTLYIQPVFHLRPFILLDCELFTLGVHIL